MKKIIAVLLFLILANTACTNKVDEPSRVVSPTAKYENDASNEQIGDVVFKPASPMEPATPMDEPYEVGRISFLAAGDNVIHPCIYIDARNRANANTRPYDFKPMYSDVADYIASFDLAFINQETLMCGDGYSLSGYPNFNSPQDLGRDLADIGFDIINIANNHSLDKGTKGLAATIDFYNSGEMSSVTMIGGYMNKEDYDRIRTVEKNGITLALLSFTEHTNGHTLPQSSSVIVPYTNDADMINKAKAAEEIADITICSVHWGDENNSVPNENQKRMARLLAENGVDVILGHHPHVLQPIEIIETDKGSTLCIYSLGNLLSAMEYWQNMVGGFFTFDIVKTSDGEVTFESPKFTPTAFFYGPSYYNSHLYFLSDYTADVAKNHGTGRLYGHPATPQDMLDYAKRIMGDYLNFEGFNE